MLNHDSINTFVSEYGRSRLIIETTVRAVLKRAEEYEEKYQKDFFDFTKDEILQMYGEARAISSRSLQNTNLVLSHAAKYFLYHADKKVVEEYEGITKEDLEPYVVKRELISLQELMEIEGQLLNATDVAIVHGLFLGLGSEWMKELTFLSPSNISKKEWKIYLKTGKIIPINHIDYQIFQDAFNEKEIISYNMIEQKITSVNGIGIYKVRGNTLYSNENQKDEIQKERRYRYMQRRMREFNRYLGISLTPKLLAASGLWYFLNQEKERLSINEFRTFLATEEAKRICLRYGFSERFYEQTVLDKFNGYL